MLTQFLLLSGVVFAGRSLREEESGRRMDAVMGGAAFGLALLARYDTVLFAVPFGLSLLALAMLRPGRRGRVAVIGSVFSLFVLHALLHQRYLAPFYHPVSGLVRWCVTAAAMVAVATVLVLATPPGRRMAAWLGARQGMIRFMAGTAVAAGMIFLWYVRPRLGFEGNVRAVFRAIFPLPLESLSWVILSGRNSSNFFYVKAIMGWPGIILATTGLVILIRRVTDPVRAIWLASSLAVLAAWMTVLFHEPFMMFISRRLIPVVIPLLAVGLAAGCAWVTGLFRRLPRAVPWIAAGAVVAVLAGQTRAGLAMAAHREWPGLIGWFDRLATHLPNDAVVYTDQEGFSAPLRFIHGRRAMEFRKGVEFDRQRAVMERAARRTPVYYLTTNALPIGADVAFTQVASLRLNSSTLATSSYDVPLVVRPRGGTFFLYKARGDPD